MLADLERSVLQELRKNTPQGRLQAKAIVMRSVPSLQGADAVHGQYLDLLVEVRTNPLNTDWCERKVDAILASPICNTRTRLNVNLIGAAMCRTTNDLARWRRHLDAMHALLADLPLTEGRVFRSEGHLAEATGDLPLAIEWHNRTVSWHLDPNHVLHDQQDRLCYLALSHWSLTEVHLADQNLVAAKASRDQVMSWMPAGAAQAHYVDMAVAAVAIAEGDLDGAEQALSRLHEKVCKTSDMVLSLQVDKLAMQYYSARGAITECESIRQKLLRLGRSDRSNAVLRLVEVPL